MWLSSDCHFGLQLLGLKRKSLIEELGDGSIRISMHDLWLEFAVMETAAGKEKHRRSVGVYVQKMATKANNELADWLEVEQELKDHKS